MWPWSKRSKFAKAQVEPLFMAVHREDPAMLEAYDRAASTMNRFVEHIVRPGKRTCSAKLRFKDPELSAQLGEDRFAYIWLTAVTVEPSTNHFAGTFFEVPKEFLQWHHVGQRLGFDAEAVFDWMVIEEGRLHGGFTLRVAREHLPAAERGSYDKFIGVETYERLPI